MSGTQVSNEIMLKNVRVAFVTSEGRNNIWEGRYQQRDDGTKVLSYGVSILFPPDHEAVPLLNAAQIRVAADKWPNTPQQPDRTRQQLFALEKQDKLAMHDGNIKAGYVGYAGNFYINANNQTRPRIVDVYGKTLTDKSQCRIYSGCYVNALVEIWGDVKRIRINTSLKGIQFLRDGDAFGGGGIAREDAFGNEAEVNDDPFGQGAPAGSSLL
jgi:hypothetical protein